MNTDQGVAQAGARAVGGGEVPSEEVGMEDAERRLRRCVWFVVVLCAYFVCV